MRVAVGPGRHNAFVVNKSTRVFQYVQSGNSGRGGWRTLPGRAMDIGVGADNTMWVVGTNTEGGGYGIYRWNAKTRRYTKIPGSALKISVDGAGNAWVVNKYKQIYAYNGSRWLRQPGAALDIGCGAEGTHWVIGANKVGRGGNAVYRKATGSFTTLWSSTTSHTLGWKVEEKGTIRWELAFRGQNEVVINVNDHGAVKDAIWSTGRFSCSKRMVMQGDGNLASYCGKSAKWSMVIGSKGPKRVGK